MCFLLKTLTIWSKDARLSVPHPTLLSTLFPFCVPLSFYVPCCLSYSTSSSLFSMTLPLFSHPLFQMDLSDLPSLLKMFVPFCCLQRCGLRQTGARKNAPAVALRLWFTERWGWSKWQRSGEATHQVTSPDASSYQRLDGGQTSIQHCSISKEESTTFSWGFSWKYLFFEALSLNAEEMQSWIRNLVKQIQWKLILDSTI